MTPITIKATPEMHAQIVDDLWKQISPDALLRIQQEADDFTKDRLMQAVGLGTASVPASVPRFCCNCGHPIAQGAQQ